MRLPWRVCGLTFVLALLVLAPSATAATNGACSTPSGGDVRVTCGSPTTPFPQNKQNEPAVAIDAHAPNIVAAGSNEEIDLQPCPLAVPTNDVRCPFTTGVGTSGIYFSTDGGQTWTQPTYQGYTARSCTPTSCTPSTGPIGTLPNYDTAGLVSDGDPTLSFGPKPDATGHFSWSNGSRLYYANLVANFSATRSEAAFKGFEAVAVSRTDDVAGAMAGSNSAWSNPVIVTKQNSTLFSDKEQIWADNAASSPNFGNVYLCNVSFRGQEKGRAAPEPVVFTRSTDGGSTWSGPKSLTAAVNNGSRSGGRQGCTVRTDSKGTVYVFFIGSDVHAAQSAIFMVRSFDGGVTFDRPQPVAPVSDVGTFDPNQGDFTIDGIAGVRTSSFPSVDIANGSPSGGDATDEIVLSWPDTSGILGQYSTNGGNSWSTPTNLAESGDHVTDDAAVAISPDGSVVYVTYDAYAQPWQTTTASPRLEQGVVRDGSATLTGFVTLHRGTQGDARGSSTNGIGAEFLGDYNYTAAQRIVNIGAAPTEFAVAVWNDSRNAADCPAIDTYRQNLFLFLTGAASSPPAKPYPGDCPAGFGNSDIYGGQFTP